MEGYSVIVLVFGVLSLLILGILYFVNWLWKYKTKIDNSFFAVKEVLNDRAELLEEMIEFVEGNLEHEKSYQKKLAQTRDLIVNIRNNKEGIETIKRTKGEVLSFVELENTYKKLGKNKDYLQIKDEILRNEEKLVYAFDSYDKGVIEYSNYRNNKFIYWLSKLCGIPEYGCYNK